MEYLAVIGFITTLVGGSAIDSTGTRLPMIVTLAGLAMMAVAAYRFNRRER